jgi:hypothetical protein
MSDTSLYKLGQLKSSVNSTSQKELGSKTDIGTSQDEMLDGRDLPLEINDLAVAKGREVL